MAFGSAEIELGVGASKTEEEEQLVRKRSWRQAKGFNFPLRGYWEINKGVFINMIVHFKIMIKITE